MKSLKPVAHEKLSRDFLQIGFLLLAQTNSLLPLCGLQVSAFLPTDFSSTAVKKVGADVALLILFPSQN